MPSRIQDDIFTLFLQHTSTEIPFWDSLLSNSLIKSDLVILGGDLNFSLGQSEVWGPHAQIDSLTGFFTQKLEENNLLDIEPIKLKPTWRNNRCADGKIAKRLDRFLVAEQIVDRAFLIRQWGCF